VGNNINTSNQTKILNKFMKKLNLDNTYRISITKKGEDIFTEASIDKNELKKRRFDDYYKICKE
jgi:hypothetical protein